MENVNKASISLAADSYLSLCGKLGETTLLLGVLNDAPAVPLRRK